MPVLASNKFNVAEVVVHFFKISPNIIFFVKSNKPEFDIITSIESSCFTSTLTIELEPELEPEPAPEPALDTEEDKAMAHYKNTMENNPIWNTNPSKRIEPIPEGYKYKNIYMVNNKHSMKGSGAHPVYENCDTAHTAYEDSKWGTYKYKLNTNSSLLNPNKQLPAGTGYIFIIKEIEKPSKTGTIRSYGKNIVVWNKSESNWVEQTNDDVKDHCIKTVSDKKVSRHLKNIFEIEPKDWN